MAKQAELFMLEPDSRIVDPRNLEWDFDDITDRWERHAWSAFFDLQSTEAERNALLSEVAQLRVEALKGICVYCGYIEQYESLEQKASDEGNAMRVAHIRQCEARPETKLIAFSERLIGQVAQLREALDNVLQCFRNGAMPDRSITDAAESALGKGKGNG